MGPLDSLILQFDRALRTVFVAAPTYRPLPGKAILEPTLCDDERRHAAALMRVNHVGEVCAQALYAGQAFTARSAATRKALEQAAREETEHLNWTETRISELGGRKSLLNPIWYAGAWTIGVIAGQLGDPISLGFLAETERQVEAHLDSHFNRLPLQDDRSRAIVAQMKSDEMAHALTAIELGARELPATVKLAMKGMARVMTGSAYWL